MSRILTSIHGKQLGLDDQGRLVAPKGVVAGDHGKQFDYPSPSKVVMFDDFLGDLIADEWSAVEGTDTTGASQAVLAGGIGGLLRLTTGDDDANGVHLTCLSGVTGGILNWQASNGGLTMQARVKMSRITTAYLFVGFTDLATAEVPINGTAGADTIATTASDAVGIMYDAGMTTAGLRLVGVANNTDAAIQNVGTGYNPVADDFITYRVDVTAAGVATFFVNGLQVGTAMSGAITAATDLTPCVYASSIDTAAALTCDVDYIHVSMNRAADGDAT